MPEPRPQAARRTHRPAVATVLALAAAALAAPAAAYVGPGAGFALVSSFAVLAITLLVAVLSILIWPFRMAWRMATGKKTAKPWVKRFVVVGLDGQDPRLTDRLLAEGKLPNFAKLAEQGCYHRIRTTFPSVSPVAWSSFSTGVNPGKHNIFDFLDRDRKTYLPMLSSAEIGSVEKFWKVGKWRIPRHKPELRLLRKSRPFWSILGDYKIWSTVLRVPITFPPDRFYGAELSAMSVPDLLGSQGTFLLFTTRRSDAKFKEGGLRVELAGAAAAANGNRRFETKLQGPETIFVEGSPAMTIPMTIDVDAANRRATVTIDGEEHVLERGKLSPWVPLTFKAAPGVKVQGLCRLQVTEMEEHFSLYVTPISIDPEKPAMPIAHPDYYSTYLAKKVGPFSTLGLAEDTWALNEDVTDDATFLQQTYDIDRERQDMFFAALEKLRRGSLVCVFDGTDRIQHMFWRYLEPGHPADKAGADAPHRKAIEELYLHNDRLVGRVMEKMGKDDVLVVLSDHGFTSFRRGINLNAWLYQNGYLVLKEGADGSAEWLRGVDWSKTRAYALGLCGMYLNVKGREGEGIVDPGEEATALRRELVGKLSGLRDAERDEVGIVEVFDTHEIYDGPYARNAQDLLIGYNHGYRTSWDCATGVVAGPVFEDNTKAWSGDHGVDPRLVPGVFFCSHPIDAADPALVDLAPTVLRLFGIDPPAHMDGKELFVQPPGVARPVEEKGARKKEGARKRAA